MTRDTAATARYARRLMRYYGYSTDSAARLACEMSPRDCMAALPLWERVWIRLRCEA